MATVPTPVTPEILLVNGQTVTTSLALANYFNKRHDNVITKINSLNCSPEFRLLNFKETVYDRPNPAGGAPIPTPCYLLTRDGFFFVAMGFTGRRAAEFKEAYIAAFNAMEQRLAQPALLAELDANYLRDALFAAMQHLAVIRQAWDGQLYDGLNALGSPLAVSLHDRVHLACWSLQTAAKYSGCDETMATALAATQPPAFPRAQHCAVATTQQGGRKHG